MDGKWVRVVGTTENMNQENLRIEGADGAMQRDLRWCEK